MTSAEYQVKQLYPYLYCRCITYQESPTFCRYYVTDGFESYALSCNSEQAWENALFALDSKMKIICAVAIFYKCGCERTIKQIKLFSNIDDARKWVEEHKDLKTQIIPHVTDSEGDYIPMPVKNSMF